VPSQETSKYPKRIQGMHPVAPSVAARGLYIGLRLLFPVKDIWRGKGKIRDLSIGYIHDEIE